MLSKTWLSILFFCLPGFMSAQPLHLHPDNPHYLLFQGKPTLLVTSAEHYGAVLNEDFDYDTYLETLQKDGMNYTRIFTGSYVEVPGSFGITNNTLGPARSRFLAPWKRVAEAGLYEGEGKFDLDAFNPAYFERLRDFVAKAAERDIVVELTFFCSTYSDKSWMRHPFNPGNNVDGIGPADRKEGNSLQHPALNEIQRSLVRKLVTELNDFDNLFYEICNEPWADNGVTDHLLLKTLRPQLDNMNWALLVEGASPATLDWQREMAQVVVNTERQLPKKHLIAQNYHNFKASLREVDPNISIINFHYAWPEAVWMNYGWDRPVNFDESGFAGSADSTYLAQAWHFMLAGGAIFNNLDYSFYPGAEDGSGINDAPGGGSPTLRRQLAFLRRFLESFDFIDMEPDRSTVHHAPGLDWTALSEGGEQYAIVFSGRPVGQLTLRLPQGRYRCEWIAPESGSTLSTSEMSSDGGLTSLPFDHRSSLLALKITRK